MITKLLLAAALALALFALFATWKSARNDAQAQIDYPPIGDFVTIAGKRVHYWKSGSGPAVVLIHGAGGNLRDYTFNLAKELAKTHTVIAFDRPGHGYTDPLHNGGATLAEQAGLLKRALDDIGIDQAVIAGYSFGGAVALRWALDYPETTKGLVLMNAVSNPWVDPPSYTYALAAGRITGPIFSTLVSAFAPQSLVDNTMRSLFAPRATPTGYLDYIGAGLSLRKVSIRANGKQVHFLRPQIVSQSARYEAELAQTPTVILHGDADITIPRVIHSDVLAKQLPHADYVVLDGVGHSVHHYGVEEVVTAVKKLSAE